MRLHAAAALLAASILASGCDSVQVERGKDLSSAGITYA